MNELIINAKNRHRKSITTNENKKDNSKYLSNLFTRILLSTIIVLVSAIYININDQNLAFFKNNLFNKTLSFNKINELYTKYFGNVAPATLTTPVSSFTDNNFKSITAFDSSYKAVLNSNVINALEGGIVVFSGEKDNLGKTVIIQGKDGVDIWYSNLDDINVTIYDYIDSSNIIGSVLDNTAILTFMEDGNYINYEKYINQI